MTCPAARRQEQEAIGRFVGQIADRPQPPLDRGAGEATQEPSQGRAKEPEGGRRRSRDIEKEQRKSMALVTVVIPCYNQAHFLGEAIESVLAQNYQHFEIIVVDDGSTDETSEVAKRYPGVRLVRQENRGLAAARNSGLAHSEGEYVVFLDADDRLLPEALEVGVGQLSAHPEWAFVAGRHSVIAVDGSLLKKRQPLPPTHVGGDLYLNLLSCENFVVSGAVMYRRSVFEIVGGFATSLDVHEDYDMYLRIARKFPVHYHSEVITEYRQHGTNTIRDLALMWKATVVVFRAQRTHVRGNQRYERAYETGMREGKEKYGTLVVEKMRTHLREREWRSAIGGILVLLRYYPQGLPLLSGRRMERHRLARRLQNRTQELQAREQRLKARERRLKEQEGALENEHQELWRLRLQVQNLERRLCKGRGFSTWRLMQRLKERLYGGAEGKSVLLAKIPAAKPQHELRSVAEQAIGAKSVGSPRSNGAPAGIEQKTRFFLVGEMKSGTSWLMMMFDSHPEILCGAEGTFFGRDHADEEIPVYEAPAPSLYNALLNCEGLRNWQSLFWNRWGKGEVEKGMRNAPRLTIDYHQLEGDLRNLTRLAIDYYMAKGSAASGKRIVGDKSPQHTEYVDEIFDFYPEAKIIHIFRDGRDVAVSLMHHFWNFARDGTSRWGIYDLEPEEIAKRDAYRGDPETFLASGESIFVEERLRQMAARWNRRVSKASRDGSKHSGSHFFQLRYEHLLERPEENLKSMLELLGARSDDDIVRRCVEENRFEKVAGRPRGREDSRSFFRKGVAGDWREVFTERDRRVYEEIAGDTLLEMGYSLD